MCRKYEIKFNYFVIINSSYIYIYIYQLIIKCIIIQINTYNKNNFYINLIYEIEMNNIF